MRNFIAIVVLMSAGPPILGAAYEHDEAKSAAPAPAITREILPTAQIAGEKLVDRVEIRKISISANQKPGAHIHPCPVVGYIISGAIVFQVEGQPERVLNSGDVFLEPANTKILRFDTTDRAAQFVAYFLLGSSDQNVIKSAQ